MTQEQGLRILLTVDAVGGVWQYGMDLARALAARGAKTVIAHLGPPPSDAQHAEAAAIRNAVFIETGLPLDWLSDGPREIVRAGERIMRLARDEGVDLVQVNMPTLAAATPGDLPVVAVAHGCVSTWWEAAHPDEPLAPDFAWHRTLTRESLHMADLVVAPSAAFAGTIMRHYGLKQAPAVVHNGRTPLVPSGDAPPHDGAFTAGRLWDRAKNAAILDGAAARLAVPFHAAGAAIGPHGEQAALKHLRLLGALDEAALAHWLGKRPVFVSAASFEPFGLAVLEAAQAGCALVLSDIPTFRELWDGAALFVPEQDEAAYAEAVGEVIGDSLLRARVGASARERAARRTPAALGHAMLALYARAIERKLPRGYAA